MCNFKCWICNSLNVSKIKNGLDKNVTPNDFNITDDMNLFWDYKIHNIYKSKKSIYKLIIFYKPV